MDSKGGGVEQMPEAARQYDVGDVRDHESVAGVLGQRASATPYLILTQELSRSMFVAEGTVPMLERDGSGNAGEVVAKKREKAGGKLRGWVAGLVAAPLALATPSAQATPTDDNFTHTTASVTVKSYNAGDSARVFVIVRDANNNQVNCISGANSDHYLSTTHPRFTQMYSAIQGAALSQRKLKLHFELIGTICWVKRVTVEF